MVKGVTRRYVLVESPDPALFEKAIFVLKDGETGTSSRELEREARRIAGEYLRESLGGRRRKPLPPVFWSLAGAGATAALWLIFRLLL
jgi:hypothetical protein